MKPAVFRFLTATLAHAGVILNTPDSNSGFFDGMSDYFNFNGTGKIGAISAAQLPESNGSAFQKLYGSFAVDTAVAVQFNFAISHNPSKAGPPNGSPITSPVGATTSFPPASKSPPGESHSASASMAPPPPSPPSASPS